MKCPVCKDVTLLMSEKSGIEIDYCPECRGIWLDHGELEKIMEKNNSSNDNQDNNNLKDKNKNKPKKKESFISEILEIFSE